MSTFEFSTLYTTLPHNLIKEKRINLIEWTFKREGSPYLVCNERHGIPMGTNCAPLVADLFLFCYVRYFMTSLSDVKQAEIIEAFKSTSRYLDDLLNIDNPYFEGMVNRIYPPELHLDKANTSGFVSSKIFDKRDDFDFDIVNFPFLDGDVPRSTSYGVYISQLIRFARVSSHVVDFKAVIKV